MFYHSMIICVPHTKLILFVDFQRLAIGGVNIDSNWNRCFSTVAGECYSTVARAYI